MIHNRLAAAFRRGNVKANVPKGLRLMKRTTEDGKHIAIVLEKIK